MDGSPDRLLQDAAEVPASVRELLPGLRGEVRRGVLRRERAVTAANVLAESKSATWVTA